MRLELNNVSCGYYANEPVIRRITMDLQDGDICCILGPNGVGKTTLFKTLLGILPTLEGSICINGENLEEWNEKRRARCIAYVAQAHVPSFPYLVEEIAMMGRLGIVGRFSQPTRHDYEIVENAMRDMGIDYLKGVPYTDISGGERQLLMIAKALAQEPDILILDEPTANLDFGNMAKVLSKLKMLAAQGLCIIFTSHLPDQAFLCNAKTALIRRNAPMVFGSCESVITKSNLESAYNAPVRVMGWVDEDGSILRTVSPVLTQVENE